MKVVIDTNCWFGILPPKSIYAFILDKFVAGDFILVVSNEIILEYEEIIGRDLKETNATNFIDLLRVLPNVETEEPKFRFNLITIDPDDNKFVDCTIISNALYLVSDDRHFEVLNQTSFPKVNLLKLKDFANPLKST
jgi:uncharacterized protein